VPLVSNSRLSSTTTIAMALTATAGFVDAHFFLHVSQVFTANMSGNLVLFGMAMGDKQWAHGAHQAVALFAFVTGVFAASRFHDLHRRAGKLLRPDLLLGIEAAILVVVAAWVGFFSANHPGERVLVYPAIALAAFAMGMQNAAVLRVGAIAVATTYATGSVARLGSESALAFGATSKEEAAAHLGVIPVLAAMIASYVFGAVFAAAVGASAAWLLLPAGVLALAAIGTHRRLRTRAE
jgi:uncharacterized membrane protein YoaK (UPF0700 family)